MSFTTPIPRWYEDFLCDIRLDSRFFRNDSYFFCRETNTTIFMTHELLLLTRNNEDRKVKWHIVYRRFRTKKKWRPEEALVIRT